MSDIQTAQALVLVLVAFGLQHLGHAVVGLDPVMQVIAHDVGTAQTSCRVAIDSAFGVRQQRALKK